MDPLSITASIVGITTAALQSVQFLVHTIDGVKGAPDIIEGVSADLRAIQPVLQSLLRNAQDSSSQIVPSEQIKHAVENCERTCRTFQAQVEQWMKNANEDGMFWVDRWKVGLSGLERVKTFRGQLSDCKCTLSVALSTATIITTSRQEHLMQEMKDMMLRQNEAVIQQQIVQAATDAREIELSMQQIVARNGNEPTAASPQLRESEQSRRELLHELGNHEAASQTLIRLCEEALSQTVFERTGQKIKGIRATNNSSALTGFINTSGEESKIDQDISDINADNCSIAVAGVVKDLDFKVLRPSGPDRGSREQ